MKLSVSNIAWNSEEEDAVFACLKTHGVTGIEVAPTKLWPEWRGFSTHAATAERMRFEGAGFSIPALQAILFGRPELSVFGNDDERSALLAHLDNVARIAGALGARVLVFGSPRNRDPGSRTPEQAQRDAAAFFDHAAKLCYARGVKICLEPNPSVYDCRFMTHWYEVKALVDTVDNPGLGVHLDTACITLQQDSVVDAIHECAGRIDHFHVSEPDLGDFSAPTIDHARIGAALRDVDYDGWVSLEMRRTDDPTHSIDEALTGIVGWYSAE